jgi:hypothetical protein
MIDIVLTALFASDLDKLGDEIETRATHDLQNSTCSDTVGNEEFFLSGDQFEVFEVLLDFLWVVSFVTGSFYPPAPRDGDCE